MSITYDFTGRKVFITGATTGIGFAAACKFLISGATICATSSSEEGAAKFKEDAKAFVMQNWSKSENSLSNIDDQIKVVVCNLANKSDCETVVEKANKLLYGIDIAVCNAGTTRDAISIAMPTEAWDEVIQVNLSANFVINKNVARVMMRSKFGRIINMSSVIGLSGNAGQANYAASKAGLIALTKTMALEFAAKNITVNAIAPGFITTAMTDALNDAVKDKILEKIPCKKFGEVDDVANTILFLSSEEAKYITGTVINISGGLLTC